MEMPRLAGTQDASGPQSHGDDKLQSTSKAVDTKQPGIPTISMWQFGHALVQQLEQDANITGFVPSLLKGDVFLNALPVQ